MSGPALAPCTLSISLCFSYLSLSLYFLSLSLSLCSYMEISDSVVYSESWIGLLMIIALPALLPPEEEEKGEEEGPGGRMITMDVFLLVAPRPFKTREKQFQCRQAPTLVCAIRTIF